MKVVYTKKLYFESYQIIAKRNNENDIPTLLLLALIVIVVVSFVPRPSDDMLVIYLMCLLLESRGIQ